MQFLWKYLDDLVGKGLDLLTLAELVVYASASLVPLALPLAILLSSIMTFGAMGEHYELVALKSSGNSLLRIMFALIVFVSFITIGAYYFSNYVIPAANLKRSTLLLSIRRHKPALNIREGEFYHGLDGYSIKVGSKTNEGKTLNDIIIYDHTVGAGAKKVIRARSGNMVVTPDERYLVFTLFEGNSYEEPLNRKKSGTKYPFLRTSFEREEIRFDLSSFQMERVDEDVFKKHYRMLNIPQLEEAIDSLQTRFEDKKKEFVHQSQERIKMAGDTKLFKVLDTLEASPPKVSNHLVLDEFKSHRWKGIIETAQNLARSNQAFTRSSSREFQSRIERIWKHEVEWHRKITLSMACLLLFFVGAPLGAIIRKGGLGMPFVVAVGIFLVYHIFTMISEKMALNGVMSPWLGMWLPGMVLLPIGFLLTYKTNRDSAIMSAEAYRIFFEKLFKKLKRK